MASELFKDKKDNYPQSVPKLFVSTRLSTQTPTTLSLPIQFLLSFYDLLCIPSRSVILTIFLTRATLALQNQKESHFYDNMLSHLCKCAFLHINWCYVPDLRGSNKIMLFPGLVSEREDKETCALLKNRSLFYFRFCCSHSEAVSCAVFLILSSLPGG